MRHGKKNNHLSRQTGHRKAMLANMACSLIEHKRINTTVAKAKALKQFVEPLITKSKEDTTHNRRIVFAYLRSKYAVTDLFRDVAAKVGDRPGGYTRIIKVGNRLGDNADMAMIELVDFNELYNGGKKEEKKGRSRRSKAKGATATAAPKAAPVAEAPVAEAAPEAVVDSGASEQAEQAPVAEVETPQVEETPVVKAETPAEPQAEAQADEPSTDEEKKEDAE
ncbi:50S ribosomal protein L17 [Flavobacterium magnum]|uniref:Large ribosomal subunit protein bL17 n=1 Tax=Flavobacterium magnum TaxID=2162713 RepID=A0A2S0RD92_9FLAO|nr:50S ribosomal protein L17 [Flavobacterium magnum]